MSDKMKAAAGEPVGAKDVAVGYLCQFGELSQWRAAQAVVDNYPGESTELFDGAAETCSATYAAGAHLKPKQP